MIRMIVGRLVSGIVVLAAVATIAFLLLKAAPGGPFSSERRLHPAVERSIEERYHLRDPLWQQYGRYLGDLARLDLGQSMKRPETVGAIIRRHFPHSAAIGLLAIGFAALVGTALGVVAAHRRNTWVDYLAMAIAIATPRAGSRMAARKVARPSGKLWMPMASAVNIPMRSSLGLSVADFGSWSNAVSASLCGSWGFSSEGTRLSMRPMSSIPPKKPSVV